MSKIDNISNNKQFNEGILAGKQYAINAASSYIYKKFKGQVSDDYLNDVIKSLKNYIEK